VNTINVCLVGTTIIVVMAQGWLTAFKEWVAGKVGETHTGQTKT
jgi:hypothetical protein